ncbi:MAG: outer membrane protein assembly factor [marine benthic group bacterium]|nr:outer membrane protein assembly factor [Gemmatimonadota bacterium]MCL7980389.1 outer membrane protein assembly factor [Gemmatimonadota bacterium]
MIRPGAAAALLSVAIALPGSASAQEVEPSASAVDTFLDAESRELIRRARAQRGREAAGLASWEATIHERISVGLTTRDLRRERGLYTSERTGRVRWDSTGVETIRWFGIRRAVPIVGDAAEIGLEDPENLIEFPVDPAGDRLILAGSPFRHPLADSAGTWYRYSSGDTMRVILPSGREIILAEVRVEPRESGFDLLAGSLWFDAASAALVRGAFRPARPFNLELDEPEEAEEVPGFLKPITVTVETMIVEYALYDLQWWLPTRTRFDGQGRMGALLEVPVVVELYAQEMEVNEPGLDPDFPLPEGWTRSEIGPCDDPREGRRRAREERRGERDRPEVPDPGPEAESEEEVDTPCDDPNGPTRIILLPPEEDLAAWFDSDEASQAAEEKPFTDDDLKHIRDQVSRISLPSAPTEPAAVRLAGFRYNRVEALSGGIRADLPLDGSTRLLAEARLGVADLVPNLTASLVQKYGQGELEMAGYWKLTDVGDWGHPFALLPSAHALLLAYDDAQYYRVFGASLGWRGGGPIRTELRAFAEGQRDAPKETDVSLPNLLGDTEFPDNVTAETVTLFGVSGRIRWQAGRDPSRPVYTATAWAEGAVGDREYLRYAGAGTAGFPLSGRVSLALEASAGSTTGSPPPQRWYYLGGVESLRAFANTPDSNRGTAFWRGRAELAIGAPVIRVLLFGDTGWAGARSAFAFDDPAISAGIGVSGLDGLLRFDVARSLRGRDPDAWRVYLSVDGLL